MIVAPEIKDSAVGLLVVNRERGVLDSAIAVRAPSAGTQRMRILEDIAVITGGLTAMPTVRTSRLATLPDYKGTATAMEGSGCDPSTSHAVCPASASPP